MTVAIVLSILCLCRLSFADALNPYTTLETKPTLVGIQLDGVIEEEWSGAARFDNFAEFMPTHQIAARVRTEGYVTHDDTDLFLAFVCYDPDIDRLRASLTDRDQIYRDDFVGIIIDTYRDQQRAYEFFSNAHGIQGDMLWNASRSERDDESFDAVWESEGRIYEDRWVVEMKIPLSCLRYPNRAQQNWGVHFVRVYPRENRYQFSWMPISQDNNSFMAQAGGLALHLGQSAMASRSLEVIPFISGSRTDELADDGTGNGVWRNQDGGSINASQRLGFTAKYRLATNHVVDFALRPDFSQIESDGGRINVNQPWAFFFPERRPFFMEGNDVFLVDYSSSGMILDVANLIYTRSINDPTVTAKATGQSDRVSYGFISAYDENTPLILPLADGTIVRSTEENSWSNIVRVKYDVAEQSHIGFAATNRRFDIGGSNTATALESSLRLSETYTLSAFGAVTFTDEPDDEGFSALIPISPSMWETSRLPRLSMVRTLPVTSSRRRWCARRAIGTST